MLYILLVWQEKNNTIDSLPSSLSHTHTMELAHVDQYLRRLAKNMRANPDAGKIHEPSRAERIALEVPPRHLSLFIDRMSSDWATRPSNRMRPTWPCDFSPPWPLPCRRNGTIAMPLATWSKGHARRSTLRPSIGGVVRTRSPCLRRVALPPPSFPFPMVIGRALESLIVAARHWATRGGAGNDATAELSTLVTEQRIFDVRLRTALLGAHAQCVLRWIQMGRLCCLPPPPSTLCVIDRFDDHRFPRPRLAHTPKP